MSELSVWQFRCAEKLKENLKHGLLLSDPDDGSSDV